MPAAAGPELDEDTLLTSIQGGDDVALDLLLRTFHSRVYGWCLIALRDPGEAEEATGQVLVAVTRTRLAGAETLTPHLRRMALNACATLLRSHGRSLTGAPTDDDAGDPAAASVDLLADGGRDELPALVWRAMAGLSPRDRFLFDAEWRDGLDNRQLGLLIGASQPYVVLNRMRRQVAGVLGTAAVAWYGRNDCREVDELVTLARIDTGREFSPVLRKRVNQHVIGTPQQEGCVTCRACRDRWPLAVFGAALPVVALPERLESRLAEIVRAAVPEPEASGPVSSGSDAPGEAPGHEAAARTAPVPPTREVAEPEPAQPESAQRAAVEPQTTLGAVESALAAVSLAGFRAERMAQRDPRRRLPLARRVPPKAAAAGAAAGIGLAVALALSLPGTQGDDTAEVTLSVSTDEITSAPGRNGARVPDSDSVRLRGVSSPAVTDPPGTGSLDPSPGGVTAAGLQPAVTEGGGSPGSVAGSGNPAPGEAAGPVAGQPGPNGESGPDSPTADVPPQEAAQPGSTQPGTDPQAPPPGPSPTAVAPAPASPTPTSPPPSAEAPFGEAPSGETPGEGPSEGPSPTTQGSSSDQPDADAPPSDPASAPSPTHPEPSNTPATDLPLPGPVVIDIDRILAGW